ncbi:MAG: trigger factor [Nitrospirae bacterium]|nr:trigger factor [Nitrospirota bacterium]MBI3352192.1 trigger factor [Nitrospirota bacterium]
MKYALVEVTPVKKTLSVEIPLEVVSKEIAVAYSQLSKTVRLPGFRKGKAPLALLEKKFHEEVKDDVLKKLIPDYYHKAVEESGIDPIEYPKIENIALEKNTPLSFKATVEVRPHFDLQPYTGLPIKIKKLTVTDANVEKSLHSLREMQAQLEPCPDDHIIVEKDFVTIDFESFIEEKPMEGGKAEGYSVEAGSKVLIPGFEENLLGKKKGNKIDFKLILPEGIKPEQNVGKEALFKVAIREIKKKILPEMGLEFAKDFGFYSVEILKEKLKEELVSRFKKERETTLKNELIKALNKRHEFELPSSLITRELVRIIRGLKDEDIKREGLLDIESIKKKFEPLARERVKGALILYAIAQKENIKVSHDEVEDEIHLIARESRMKEEEVKKNILEVEGSFSGIESRLLEDKALVYLMSKAQIEEEE